MEKLPKLLLVPRLNSAECTYVKKTSEELFYLSLRIRILEVHVDDPIIRPTRPLT